MNNDLAKQFVDALYKLEASQDLDSIVALFADDSHTGNVVTSEALHGVEGARTFWQNYRGTFKEVRSTFRNQIVTDGNVALEWTTEGTNGHGKPITYDGVSILETQNGKITRFFAYFDPKHLGEEITK